MVVVEVCVEDVAGVRAARAAGAARVELCCALGEGGLTPSHGALAAAVEVGGIEVVALVRPRAGDFLYSEEELAVIERDVECARTLGAHGVALGCLTPDGEVDEPRCARLIARAAGLSVTFHRAFDHVRAPETALESLVRLGAARVRIEVVAAGGVRPDHARALVEATGVGAVHFSAAVRREGGARHRNPRPRLAAPRASDEHAHWETDEARVRAVVQALA